METVAPDAKKRFLSIDIFRGLTIAVMVFVNTVGDFTDMPDWTRHARDYGLTYVDLVAPFFIFAIALTYHLTYVQGQNVYGALNNNLRVIRRYFALMGMGFLAWAIIDMVGAVSFKPVYSWGVFQAIGFAGLITLAFINLPRWWRLAAAIMLWVIYQWLILTQHIDDINFAEEHSGLWGGLGYGIMMTLATVVCEAFETQKMRDFLIAGTIFLAAGVITAHYWGVSKNRLTGPYILISQGAACFFFYIMWFLFDKSKPNRLAVRIFEPIGKNPFFLYAFHGVLMLIPFYFLKETSRWYWVSLLGVVNTAIIWLVATWLDKKKIYISI